MASGSKRNKQRRSAAKKMARRAESGPRAKPSNLLRHALAAHQSGQLDEARRSLALVLEHEPENPVALHVLGLVLHGLGHTDEGIGTLEHAARVSPDDASVRSNLGNLLSERGRTGEAAAAYRAALAHDARHAGALFNLAALMRDSGKPRDAAECYQKLLRLTPGDAEVWNNLAGVQLALGDAAAGRACAERALSIEPRYPRALLNLAAALLARADTPGARTALERAIAISPDLADAHLQLAELLRSAGMQADAERAALEAARLDPANSNTQLLLARLRMEVNDPAGAISAYRQALELRPRDAEAWCELASALTARGMSAESLDALRRAQSIAPDAPKVRYALGLAELREGRTDSARASFEAALREMPNSPELWFNLSKARRFGPEDDATVARIEGLSKRGGAQRAMFEFTLAKMRDDRKEYAAAFEHYACANRLVRAQVEFDPAEMPSMVDASIEVFTPALFERLHDAGDPSRRPVFIFGMPRSGTTLVEQILAAHPRVHGAGELTHIPELVARLPDFVRDLSTRSRPAQLYPGVIDSLTRPVAQELAGAYLGALNALDDSAAKVTDKLPGNYLYLGLIAILFPGATLVHCVRDPMDVCWSNFTQYFADGMGFANDLGDLGHTYVEYERVMRHWRAVLPLPVHEVRYEALIDDQAGQTRALLEFCDLEWDPRCLEFFGAARSVNTASNWQVRRPIYRDSVARWRRYEPWLGELREALAR